VSAQNVANEPKYGAYTGELPAPMLKDFGINWTLTGKECKVNDMSKTLALFGSTATSQRLMIDKIVKHLLTYWVVE